MKKSNTISIDLAKSVFQIAVINPQGKIVSNKPIKRHKLLKWIAQQPLSKIVMEACGSSNYWGRQFQEFEHQVKLIAAQHVKPFVKTNKNDAIDVIAIFEASDRPNMTFVGIKNLQEQDMQSILRVRKGLMDRKVKLMNQARGLLAEYGVIFPTGAARLKAGFMALMSGENQTQDVTSCLIGLVEEWYQELIALESAIDKKDKTIQQMTRQSEVAQRLMKIEGIGPLTAMTMISTVGSQATEFKNGRAMAAFLGLTPKQHSSGGKTKLGRISRHGDKHLRTLLVNGATSVMKVVEKKTDPKSQWVKKLGQRMHKNKAKLALANKMARIAWVILARGETYKPQLASTVN